MICVDCGQEITVNVASDQTLETGHSCGASIAEDCDSLIVQGVTVFEANRMKGGE